MHGTLIQGREHITDVEYVLMSHVQPLARASAFCILVRIP